MKKGLIIGLIVLVGCAGTVKADAGESENLETKIVTAKESLDNWDLQKDYNFNTELYQITLDQKTRSSSNIKTIFDKKGNVFIYGVSTSLTTGGRSPADFFKSNCFYWIPKHNITQPKGTESGVIVANPNQDGDVIIFCFSGETSKNKKGFGDYVTVQKWDGESLSPIKKLSLPPLDKNKLSLETVIPLEDDDFMVIGRFFEEYSYWGELLKGETISAYDNHYKYISVQYDRNSKKWKNLSNIVGKGKFTARRIKIAYSPQNSFIHAVWRETSSIVEKTKHHKPLSYNFYNGEKWMKPLEISGEAVKPWSLFMAVDQTGKVHIAWTTRNKDDSYNVYYRNFIPVDNKWSVIENISGILDIDGIIVDKLNRPFIWWNDYKEKVTHCKTRINEGVWSKPYCLNPFTLGRVFFDSKNNLHIIWRERGQLGDIRLYYKKLLYKKQTGTTPK